MALPQLIYLQLVYTKTDYEDQPFLKRWHETLKRIVIRLRNLLTYLPAVSIYKTDYENQPFFTKDETEHSKELL